jgi:hypothetical protein
MSFRAGKANWLLIIFRIWPKANEHTLVVPTCVNSSVFVRQVLDSLIFLFSARHVRHLRGITDGLTLRVLLEDSPLCIKGNTLQGETVSDAEAEKRKTKIREILGEIQKQAAMRGSPGNLSAR